MGVLYPALASGFHWSILLWCAVWFGNAAWLMRSAQRGWKLNYSIPERALRDAKRKGIIGEATRDAIKATEEEAKNPNRKRYAFD